MCSTAPRCARSGHLDGHPSSAHSCQMPGHSPALQLPDTIRSLHQEGQRLAAEKDQERLVTVPAAAVKEGELPASAGGGTPGGEAVSQTTGPSEAQGELPACIHSTLGRMMQLCQALPPAW